MAKRELGLHLLIKMRPYTPMISCCDDLMTEGMRLWMQIDYTFSFLRSGPWDSSSYMMQGEDLCGLRGPQRGAVAPQHLGKRVEVIGASG